VDIIFISDLRIETVIGIFDWERRIKQTVVLDLEMAGDCRKAAASDSVEDTLDYKSVAKRLMEFVGASEYQLVETLAERCAELIMEEFGVPWLRLKVNKQGALRGARDVGVIIERGRRD
jgi:dihydroneopterin aldolase